MACKNFGAACVFGFLASIHSFIIKNTWDSIVGGRGDNGLHGSYPNLCLHVHFMYFLFR